MSWASSARILIAEDDAIVARDLETMLGDLGYEVVATTRNGEEAMDAAWSKHPDLALLDIRMPGAVDGVEAGKRIMEHLQIPVVYVTAYGDDSTMGKAVGGGSFGYVLKPFNERELKAAIEVGLHRSWMEKRLRASEQLLSATLRCMGEAVVATDASGAVTFMNAEAERITGWKESEAVGQPVETVVRLRSTGPEGAVKRPVDEVFRRQRAVRVDPGTVLVGAEDQVFPVTDSVAPVMTDDRRMVGAVLVIRDETEAREREEALSWSEERLSRLFQQDVAGHVVLSPDGEIWEINPAMLEMLEFSSLDEAQEHFRTTLIDGSLEDLLRAVRERGQVEHLELSLRTRTGAPVHVFGNLVGLRDDQRELAEIHGHFIDVTERRKLQDQLNQIDKMNAVGRLAGGIAHDFNNILTTIHGYADLLLEGDALPAEVVDDVVEIRQAAQRASDLTRQLLTLSRGEVGKPELVGPNELILEMIRMLQRLVGEDLELRTSLDDDLMPVRIDPSRFQQVILNLVVNAREAMPAGGTVTIRTRSIAAGDIEEAAPLKAAELEAAVAVEVSDSGVGMTEEEIEHVFEPFYSTKVEGTGLGMAIIWGIVDHAGGTVTVSSEKGRGTTVRVLLPAALGG